MQITDIKIRRTFSGANLKALVSITLDNEFAVHDIKVIEGAERIFVAMPSRKDEVGIFHDIVHPINPETRSYLESAILEKYAAHISEQQEQEASEPEINETVAVEPLNQSDSDESEISIWTFGL